MEEYRMKNKNIYHGSNVEGFISGKVPRDVFWGLVKFSYPTHQIVFCTEEALKTLTFEGSDML